MQKQNIIVIFITKSIAILNQYGGWRGGGERMGEEEGWVIFTVNYKMLILKLDMFLVKIKQNISNLKINNINMFSVVQ